jgi:hypothetical protein
MKTIEQLKIEQEKALAALQGELGLAAALPLPPDRVMFTGKAIGTPWITYKVKGLRGAIDVFKAFTIVPTSVLKEGCTSVKPAELVPVEKQEKAEGTYAAWIDVRQGDGFGPNAEFLFFARIPGHGVVRVCADIEGPGYIGVYRQLGATVREERGGRGNRITGRTFSANGELYALTDYRIQWASGDMGPVKTSANISYFLCADQCDDMPGASQSHALAQLEIIIDKFEPLPEQAGE